MWVSTGTRNILREKQNIIAHCLKIAFKAFQDAALGLRQLSVEENFYLIPDS
jgi:hypothetical protein